MPIIGDFDERNATIDNIDAFNKLEKQEEELLDQLERIRAEKRELQREMYKKTSIESQQQIFETLWEQRNRDKSND